MDYLTKFSKTVHYYTMYSTAVRNVQCTVHTVLTTTDGFFLYAHFSTGSIGHHTHIMTQYHGCFRPANSEQPEQLAAKSIQYCTVQCTVYSTLLTQYCTLSVVQSI